MQEFLDNLANINVLEARLMQNDKERSLSLFNSNLENQEYFGDVYSTVYKGSFAQLAQAQRHRTIDYQIEMLKEKEYYIPPIIADDQTLVDE